VNEKTNQESKLTAPTLRSEDDLHSRDKEQILSRSPPWAKSTEPIGVLEILAASTWRRNRARP